MAIDTAAKRCSAIATRRLPWFRRFEPRPDATVDLADRQQLGFVYRGIAAAAAEIAATWTESARGITWTEAARSLTWEE